MRKNEKYTIRVCLECTYDDIIAENDEDAFIQASDLAMQGDDWCCKIEIEDVEEIDEESEEQWWQTLKHLASLAFTIRYVVQERVLRKQKLKQHIHMLR